MSKYAPSLPPEGAPDDWGGADTDLPQEQVQPSQEEEWEERLRWIVEDELLIQEEENNG